MLAALFWQLLHLNTSNSGNWWRFCRTCSPGHCRQENVTRAYFNEVLKVNKHTYPFVLPSTFHTTKSIRLSISDKLTVPCGSSRFSTPSKSTNWVWDPINPLFKGKTVVGGVLNAGLHPVLRLRMRGATPLLPHMPSWHEQGQLYFTILWRRFIICLVYVTSECKITCWR